MTHQAHVGRAGETEEEEECQFAAPYAFKHIHLPARNELTVPSAALLCVPGPLRHLHSNGTLLLGNPQYASNTGRILRKPHLFLFKGQMNP